MKWEQRTGEAISPELIEQFQLSPITAKLFSLRGITTEEQLNFWFNATEENLADPSLMHDLDKAVDRIMEAVDAGQKITVYGDYDADGITATAIMTETLSILGADVHYFIPDRFKDGYGPNMESYQKLVADGTKLIITVDNGITGVEEIAYAKKAGVDTILTDHHTIQDQIPDAYAVVHCNYPGQAYPFDDYCGAGVAYTICRQLMQDPMTDLLDLAMIGTIGDMVKVSGEGHIIVKRGLEVLNQTSRVGLQALIKQAGLKAGTIDETDVGFNIAPRLNATGRLANASLAVELLLTDDELEADKLAKEIEDLNNERKDLTKKVFSSCLEQVKQNGLVKEPSLVIYDPSFHEGVLGLVANKIVEELHKPTIVLTKNDQGEIKGSGRSTPNINLFDSLEPLKQDLLTKFGGHDFACGLSLTEDKIDLLRKAFKEHLVANTNSANKKYDLELSLKQLKPDVMTEIQAAGPYGTDHPKPIFSLTAPQISHFIKIGSDKNHVRFTVGGLTVLGFNMGYLTSELLPYVNRIFVELGLNNYRGKSSLQGIIAGLEFGSPQYLTNQAVIDLRREKYVMGFADKYLFFDPKNLKLAQNQYNLADDQVLLLNDYHGEAGSLVLLDTPRNLNELNQALEPEFDEVYLRFLVDQLPVSAIPNEAQFRQVLKYIYTHPALSPEDYQEVAPFLGMDYEEILFVLRVFFELRFVKLADGKLVKSEQVVKTPLNQSKYLQSAYAKIKFANQLRTMPSQRLVQYVNRFVH